MKVAFIGASVTYGADYAPANTWSYQTGQYLAGKYRSVVVKDFSVPGTGAMFGAYRIKAELGDFVPDIAFIELTINDSGATKGEVWSYTDAVVHQLRQRNPSVMIIYVALTHAGEETARRAGQLPPVTQYTSQISAEEGMLFIDAGASLWQNVISGSQTVSALLPDNVHPSAAGHSIYFNAVKARLDTYLPTATITPAATSKYFAQTNLADARIVPVSAATGCGRGAVPSNLSYLNDSLVCMAGESFSLDFSGTTLGFIQGATLDAANLSCTVDGAVQPDQGFLLGIAANPSPAYPKLNFTNLKLGNHQLKCTVNAIDSTHNRVAIGGFLVSSEVLLNP